MLTRVCAYSLGRHHGSTGGEVAVETASGWGGPAKPQRKERNTAAVSTFGGNGYYDSSTRPFKSTAIGASSSVGWHYFDSSVSSASTTSSECVIDLSYVCVYCA